MPIPIVQILFLFLLITDNVIGEYWGGFQYYGYPEWPGLSGHGYNSHDTILDLFYPKMIRISRRYQMYPILHRDTTDSPWKAIHANDINDAPIYISTDIAINTVDLTHLDGAFFSCIIRHKIIVIQFIFTDDNWNIRQRELTAGPIPKTDEGHENAQRYGDVDSWWQFMHYATSKTEKPFHIVQGFDASCPKNALNVLLQGDEVTNEEMTDIQETRGFPWMTFEEATESGFTGIMAYVSDTRSAMAAEPASASRVWDPKVYTIVEERRHVRSRYTFRKGHKVEIYGTPRDDSQVTIGYLVMGLANGQLYTYNFNEWIRTMDDTGVTRASGGDGALTDEDKRGYRYVTVSELWGDVRIPGSFYGETVHSLDAAAVEQLDNTRLYYDSRDPDTILYQKLTPKELRENTPAEREDDKLYDHTLDASRSVVFDARYHKAIKFPVTNLAHQRALHMTDSAMYADETKLPYNLLGFYITRPGHAFSYRKVGDHWYNLDSGFAYCSKSLRLRKTWDVLRADIGKQLYQDQGTEDKKWQVNLMVRSPEFIPLQAASRSAIYTVPESKHKHKHYVNVMDDMINMLEKEKQNETELLIVSLMGIGFIELIIIIIFVIVCCCMAGFLVTYLNLVKIFKTFVMKCKQ